MIAVDTNILVYAHRPEFPLHDRAKRALDGLAASPSPWAIVIHCLVEFAGVVSHPKRFRYPSSASEIADQVAAWREAPGLSLLGDSPLVLDRLMVLIEQSKVTGARTHDARIAATCLASGVRELWTCDRDYGRFAELTTRNPLVDPRFT